MHVYVRCMCVRARAKTHCSIMESLSTMPKIEISRNSDANMQYRIVKVRIRWNHLKSCKSLSMKEGCW